MENMLAEPINIRIATLSDSGMVRKQNEDAFGVSTDLSGKSWDTFQRKIFHPDKHGVFAMIADGMGGMKAGNIASDLAVKAVEEFFCNQAHLPTRESSRVAFLFRAIQFAHQKIVDAGKVNRDQKGMGTTAVLAWVVNGKAHLVWSGDSRAYLWRPGEGFTLLTDDHAIVWDKVKAGELTPEEARVHPESNIITQSLGDESHPPAPDANLIPLQKGDRLMLCSDGLSGMLSNETLETIFAQPMLPDDTCRKLIDAANMAGGKDNTTVILLELIPSKKNKLKTHNHNSTLPMKRLQPEKFSVMIFFLCLICFAGCMKENKSSDNDGVAQIDTLAIASIAEINEPAIDSIEVEKEIVNLKDYVPISKEEKEIKTDVIPPCNDVQRAEIASRKKLIQEMEESLGFFEKPEEKEAYQKNINSSKKDLADMIKSYACE